MRKITTIVLAAVLLGGRAGAVCAVENDYRPYLGAGYAYDEVRAKGHHSYHNAGIVNIGSVYNKYFGTELFYQYADKHKFGGGEDLKNSSFRAYGLDMAAYLPLGCDGRLAPTATLGIGEYVFKNEHRFAKDRRERGWGYRFGAGLTYHLDENWALRGLYRYIKLDKVNGTDHINEYSFGFRYTFD